MRVVSIDVHKSGARIKAVAEQQGYSPEQIKMALKLESVRAVYLWYEGKRLPTVDNLLLLARLLKVPMDHLVVGVNDDQWTDEQKGCRVEEIYQWAVMKLQQTVAVNQRCTYFEKDGVKYLAPADMLIK